MGRDESRKMLDDQGGQLLGAERSDLLTATTGRERDSI